MLLNVTVTSPKSSGYVTAWAGGPAPMPIASNLNYSAGETIANLVSSPVADGEVSLFNGSGGTIDLIADVEGYVEAGATTVPGTIASLAPTRLLDTRSGVGAHAGAVSAGQTIGLPVAGHGGVPATGVSAVVLNITVTGSTDGGWISAWAGGEERPLTSDLNYGTGETRPNLVIVPVGADGSVWLINGSLGSAHLIADVAGYVVGNPPTSWSAPEMVDPPSGSMTSVSCVSASFCAAVDSAGAALTFDGTTWSAPVSIDPIAPEPMNSYTTGHFSSVSCVSTTFCIAVDMNHASSYDGVRGLRSRPSRTQSSCPRSRARPPLSVWPSTWPAMPRHSMARPGVRRQPERPIPLCRPSRAQR